MYEAPLSLRATTTGAGSTLAGIGRLVTAAQVGGFTHSTPHVLPLSPPGPSVEQQCGGEALPALVQHSQLKARHTCCQPLDCVIVRWQAREAPVQRLADMVAGRFCYSVMAASAATFAFWSLLGAAS